ncbi:MAG: PHP domain-containing protein [Chitinophagaceae bacterium]|nr:PHP domain-containing protein [Chitinophagaceae bacterium]
MKLFFLFIFCSTFFLTSFSQRDHSHKLERSLSFPDIPGYKTLKCDLHQHSVFSDGSVWPTIRVMEALKDGLDAISITEHIEYQPHKTDIPHPDRNRSYAIAIEEAKGHNLIIINGSEITRKMPPGHCNAIFLSDANKLLVSDSMEVFRRAKKQGAFIFWNHPDWLRQRPDGVATLTDMHRKLLKENLLDGIEVVNEHTYSDEALQIALDNNLTIMGTSDIHGLIDWEYGVPKGGHRPITLVFAKERTSESIKEGLMNKRTVAFYKNILIGREEFLLPLINASLKIDSAKYISNSNVLTVQLENTSSTEFTLQNRSEFTFRDHTDIITIKPREKHLIQIKTLQRLSSVELKFEVLSAVYAPGKHPVATLRATVN